MKTKTTLFLITAAAFTSLQSVSFGVSLSAYPASFEIDTFRLNVTGAPGAAFVVEWSTNLTNWQPGWTNLIPAEGSMVIIDPMILSAKFYRVKPFTNGILNSITITSSTNSTMIQNRRDLFADATTNLIASENPTLSPERVAVGIGRNDSDQLCAVTRPFIVFQQTAALPAGANIIAAELVMNVDRKSGAGLGGTIPVNDNQTYVRVVEAYPSDPANIAPSDLGLISRNEAYSEKRYFRDVVEGQRLVVPLRSAAFGQLTNAVPFTYSLMDGHELEMVDHFQVINGHNHHFFAPDTAGQSMPQIRIVYLQ